MLTLAQLQDGITSTMILSLFLITSHRCCYFLILGVMEKACLKGERAKQRLHDIIAKQIMGKGKNQPKHPSAQHNREFVTPQTNSVQRKTLTRMSYIYLLKSVPLVLS